MDGLAILSASQMKELDFITLQQERMNGWELMERAVTNLTAKIIQIYSDPDTRFLIFCGKGNNGGDGLGIARMLRNHFRYVEVITLYDQGNTEEYAVNLDLLSKMSDIKIQKWENFSKNIDDTVIIDAVLGFSCKRKPEFPEREVIDWINHSGFEIIAIDIPSGMPVDFIPDWPTVQATHTLNIGPIKLTSLLPETGEAFGKCYSIDIGHAKPSFLSVHRFLMNRSMIQKSMKRRSEFGHKGSFGHAAMVVGSKGMMGAAVLAVKACLRSGVGLVTSLVPDEEISIMQMTCPEALCHAEKEISNSLDLGKYSALGIGCGIGTEINAKEKLKYILSNYAGPLVLDADALNIIAEEKISIPKYSIITPHPKEFDRLFGSSSDSLKRLDKQVKYAAELGITIILKGHHTSIATPDGDVYFNITGNSGMAKGGSGDVLTGLVTGLLAQGYLPELASSIGVYIHGLAGDKTAEKIGKVSMTAGDLTEFFSAAFIEFEDK